jgi:RNA polymerase sigma-70 factor (ECF subfamily)
MAIEPAPAEFVTELLAQRTALIGQALRLVRRRPDAEDAAQGVMVKALCAWQQFTPGTNMRAWLFTILRNYVFNETRARRLVPVDDAIMVAVPAVERQGPRDDLRDLERAMATLRPDHRAILLAAADSDDDYQVIALELGIEIGTVKSRLSRARKQLRDALGYAGE